jgi:glutathione S-transferase
MAMLELIQFPWSPFCIVQRRILEYSGAPFKIVNIPANDRSLVWRLTRQRYYGVPIVKDGKKVIFETDDNTQIIAKYLDYKLRLTLFPVEWRGLQQILWRYIENDIEEMTFKLNDIYWLENVPPAEQVSYVRHKERKFGRGCLDHWRANQSTLVAELTRRLQPFEEMLRGQRFLLDAQPRFVDFDLYSMLGNFLHSGHYRLPDAHARLKQWHRRMAKLKFQNHTREKLRS